MKKKEQSIHARTHFVGAKSHKLITTVREGENAKGKVFGYKSCRTTMLNGTNLRHFFFFVLEFDLHFASMGLGFHSFVFLQFGRSTDHQRKHRTVVIRCGRLHGAVVAHERAPLSFAVLYSLDQAEARGQKGEE